MSQSPPSASIPGIAIADVLRGMLRRKLAILLITLLGFGTAFAFVNMTKPRYSTEARVIVENLDTPFDRVVNTEGGQRAEISEREVASEIGVIQSYDLGERVVNGLKLTERAEFDPLLAKKKPGFVSSMMLRFGFGSDPAKMTPLQRAMDRLNNNLTVYPVGDSKLIAIKYQSTDPATAAEVANALAETYVMSTREAQSAPTGRARDWLAGQIEELRQKVADAELAVEQFRSENELLRGTGSTLNAEELTELNKQITVAQTQRAEAAAKADSIRSLLEREGNVDSSAEVTASPVIQRLMEQQSTAQAKLTDLAVTYLPNHPKMQAAQKTLDSATRQIRREALKIAAGLEEQEKIAAAREASLRRSLEGLKTREKGNNVDDVKLRALEREATASRSLLENMMARYTDASARDDLVSQPGKARIIQRAPVPTEVAFPKSGPTVLLSTIAGFILSLGLAFFLEVMAAASRFTRAQQRLDIEAAAAPVAAVQPQPGLPPPPVLHVQADLAPQPPGGPSPGGGKRPEGQPLAQALAAAAARQAQAAPLPSTASPVQPLRPAAAEAAPAALPAAAADAAADALPSICEMPASPDLSSAAANAAEAPGSRAPFASSMRRLSAWAANARQTFSVRRLGVISIDSQPLDLAAAVAGLARDLASQDFRVIVLDVATANSALSGVFGIAEGPGLAELLSGESSFAETIQIDSASPVQVVRAGLNRASLASYAGSNRMETVLGALDNAYDYVIVAAGPAGSSAAAAARKCHGALVIASAGQMVATSRAVQDLRQAGLRAVSCIRIAEQQGFLRQGYAA